MARFRSLSPKGRVIAQQHIAADQFLSAERNQTITACGVSVDAASDLERQVGLDTPTLVRTKKRKPAADRERAVEAAREIFKAEDWDSLAVAHLVAFYLIFHREVYGADAPDLVGNAWRGACSAASKLVRDEFGGDKRQALEFLRWTWARERERERWRREHGRDGRRICWRQQFVWRSLLAEYRVANERMELPR